MYQIKTMPKGTQIGNSELFSIAFTLINSIKINVKSLSLVTRPQPLTDYYTVFQYGLLKKLTRINHMYYTTVISKSFLQHQFEVGNSLNNRYFQIMFSLKNTCFIVQQ